MTPEPPIDRISFGLLSELANDGRLSNKQLAGRLGIAPSTAHYRLKQLWASGAYLGSHAEVDLKKLGVPMRALLQIALVKQRPEDVATLLERLKAFVEVRQFLIVTGRVDLIVELAIRDTDHLRSLEFELAAHPLIDRIETAVIFEAWRQHSLPRPSWLGGDLNHP